MMELIYKTFGCGAHQVWNKVAWLVNLKVDQEVNQKVWRQVNKQANQQVFWQIMDDYDV